MKTYKFYRTLLIIFISLFVVTSAFSQETKEQKKQNKTEEIQNLLQSKKFVFITQTVMPQSGRTINLTSTYTLQISGDTVVCQLPYFGRAYAAPLNPSDGGFNFTSSDFNYSIQDNNKGEWEIVILPKGQDVRQMFLTVSDNGNATLRVNSTNRQSLSYNGYISGKSNS